MSTEIYNITFNTYKHCSCLLFEVMSELRAKHVEGTSVDAPHLDAPREGTSPTQQEEIPRVTTPIDVGGLVDSFFKVSLGNPQRGASESPVTNADHEVSKLDMGL